MILIINTCKERLHYFEFVKPIVDVVKDVDKFVVIKYDQLNDAYIRNANKIIITGTSLQDFGYIKNDNPKDSMKLFEFLKTINKPVLGICGGMQIICKVFGCKLVRGQEIGLINVKFDRQFLSMQGNKQVYALHNMAIKEDVVLKKHFDVYSKTKYVQAIKHKDKQIYAVLFHPEVRNMDMIKDFLRFELTSF
jgi:GMP synthase-like glutamine amidotransferase